MRGVKGEGVEAPMGCAGVRAGRLAGASREVGAEEGAGRAGSWDQAAGAGGRSPRRPPEGKQRLPVTVTQRPA